MKIAKGFKLTIYILLAVMLISCFSVLGIALNKDKSTPKPENPKAADLTISNLAELKAFANASGSGSDNYAGKTVVLANNIDCGGADLSFGWEDALGGSSAESNNRTFAGTFDGQGYTISNVTRSIGLYDAGDYAGFFCRNSGTIKNVRFKDFAFNIGNDTADFTGCIVGKNTGTIESCIVENCEFVSDRYRTNCYVAPIAGKNDGTVKNCMVLGSYLVGGNGWNLVGNPDGAMSYFFTASGNNAVNSIYQASWDECGDADSYDYVYSPYNAETDGGSVDARDSWNYSSCISAYNYSTDSSNSYKDTFSDAVGDSGTPWFKYKYKYYSGTYTYRGRYGDGNNRVWLRAFVGGWTTYYFNSADTNMGTVSTGSITVPNDYATISGDGQTKTTGYDYECRAYPKAAYSFSHWTNSGNSYTAHFTGKVCNIAFYNFSDDVIVDTYGTMSLEAYYYMNYGANLQITYDFCGKREQQYTYWTDEWNGYYEDYVEKIGTAYCLNALTFEFYAKDENGKWANRKITYKPKNSTQCIGVDVNGFEAWLGDYSKKYNYGANQFEPYSYACFDEPMLLNKEYNITFG